MHCTRKEGRPDCVPLHLRMKRSFIPGNENNEVRDVKADSLSQNCGQKDGVSGGHHFSPLHGGERNITRSVV